MRSCLRHLPAVGENTHLCLVLSRDAGFNGGKQNILEFTEQVSFCSMLKFKDQIHFV